MGNVRWGVPKLYISHHSCMCPYVMTPGDATTKTGIRILARQPTPPCHLQVRIGTLTTPDTTFTITMR
ncbi:MAG: hypothetical protein LBI33_03250 [Propionibacteriaceae bacterium]|nr:hypothetical protein [Propionibacteriaceae bacterium]